MLWQKIKYVIDNLSDKDEEEKNGIIFSRRKFLISLPALVVVPKLVEGVRVNYTALSLEPPLKFSAYIGDEFCGVSDEFPKIELKEFSDFISPGAIELNRYQSEIMNLVKRNSVFGQRFPVERRKRK